MKAFVTIVLAVLAAMTAPAQELSVAMAAATAGFPDTAEIRQRFSKELLMARLPRVLEFRETVTESKVGRVLVRVTQATPFVYTEYLREVDGAFPQAAAGSCVVQRETSRGFIVYAKIFLNSDPSCYVKFMPVSDQSKIDVVMYGAVIAQDVYTPWNFILQLGRSIAIVADSTQKKVDWKRIFRADAVPGARERLATALRSGVASGGAYDKLFTDAADLKTGSVVVAPSYMAFANISDQRLAPADYAAFPKAAAGIPFKASRAAIFSAATANPSVMTESTAFVVAFSGNGPFSRLVLVPHVGTSGTFELLAVDAQTRRIVDMTALLQERSEQVVTIRAIPFSIP